MKSGSYVQSITPAWVTPSSWETPEVQAIEGQNRSPEGGGILEQLSVGIALMRFPIVEDGQHVVTQTAEFFDDEKWEVLIGIEPGHCLCVFIRQDLPVDLSFMRIVVGPGIHEIFGAQGGIGSENV